MTRRRWLEIVTLLTMALALVGVASATSEAAPYLNSSEPMCNGSDSSVLMCDDFEDGDWAQTTCEGMRNGTKVTTNPQAYAPNKGWCMTIYYSDDFAGNNNFTVNMGAGGTSRAATSGMRSGNSGMMGSHGLPGDYTEIYVRQYIYFPLGYVGGHEKMLDILPVTWGPGGGDIIALGYNHFGSNRFCWIPYKYQDGGRAGNPGPAWMCQNQLPGTGADSLGNPSPSGLPITWVPGHWYYLEVHIKLNTGSNYDGHYNMWMDDCGTNGLGCTGPGTLRASYKDIKYWTPSDISVYKGNIKGIWEENWSNPASIGVTYYDQIVVAKRRIRPMGGSSAPPSSPTQTLLQ